MGHSNTLIKTPFIFVKRSLLLLMSVLFISISMWANPITPMRAKQIAEAQFQKSPLRSSEPVVLSATRTSQGFQTALRTTENSVINAYYYVFNRGNNEGFVIVSADDRTNKVFAYSYTGHFDINNLPQQAAWYIKRYDKGMEALLSGADNALNTLRSTKSLGEPIQPLLEKERITWNQGAPYNDLCPTFGEGQRAYTGCVATAVAQILRYHKFPKHAVGKVSYSDRGTRRNMNFKTEPYDWANMLPDYPNYGKQASQAERAAVARLLVEVGYAVHMSYAVDNYGSSGAMSQIVPNALRDHFNCNKSVHYMGRFNYPDSVFRSTIYNELKHNRPVYYSGAEETSSGGHAFVCDGYDENGLFHFNWGWGGVANGYFMLENLQPSSLGAGAGEGKFSGLEDIVVGIEESKGDNEPLYPVLPNATVRTRVDADNTQLSTSIILVNSSSMYMEGDYQMHLVKGSNPQGEVLSIFSEKKNKSLNFSSFFSSTSIVQSKGLEDGDYCLVPTWKGRDDDQFRMVLPSLDEPLVTHFTVKGGHFSNVAYDSPLDNISYVKGSFSTDLNAYTVSHINLTLENTSVREYYGMIKIEVGKAMRDGKLQQVTEFYKLVLLKAQGQTPVTLTINQLDCAPNEKIYVKVILPKQLETQPVSYMGNTLKRLSKEVYLGEGTARSVASYDVPTYVASSTAKKGELFTINLANDNPCNITYTVKNLGPKDEYHQMLAVLEYRINGRTGLYSSQDGTHFPSYAGETITYTPEFSKYGLSEILLRNPSKCYLVLSGVMTYGDKVYLDHATHILGDARIEVNLVRNTATNEVTIVPKGSCYPNPADAQTTVTYGEGVTSIDLFNINGQLLHSYSPEVSGTTTIDTSLLPAGNYVVGLRTANGVTSVILQVKH